MSREKPAWLPYLVPYVLFIALAFVGEEIPGARYLSYPLKSAAVAVAVLYFYRAGSYPELDLKPSVLGVAAGLLGFALWIVPENALSFLPKLGDDPSFDPHGAGEGWFVPLVITRFVTATLLVPVFEELFLRSFLLRYIDCAVRDEDGEDFRKIPIGRYRLPSFIGVILAMAITHHRWLRAGLFSGLMCLLLYREKRMGPVIWAHAITNLALCVYAVITGHWALS